MKDRLEFKRFFKMLAVPALVAGMSLGAHAADEAKKAPAATPAAAHAQNKDARDKQGQVQRMAKVRASKLIGKDVRDGQGKKVGEIKDLIVSMQNDQVRYAVLEVDRGFMEGDRMLAVPLRQFKVGSDRDALVMPDAEKSRLQQAAMDKKDWDKKYLATDDKVARLDQSWGMQREPAANLRRASDLMDVDVKSSDGKKVGEIDDLVVDMGSQKVQYSVFKFDPGWFTPERLMAVPLHAFKRTDERDELALNVDKAKIQNLKGLERRHLGDNLDDPQLHAAAQRDLAFFDGSAAQANAAETATRQSGAGAAAAAPTHKDKRDKK